MVGAQANYFNGDGHSVIAQDLHDVSGHHCYQVEPTVEVPGKPPRKSRFLPSIAMKCANGTVHVVTMRRINVPRVYLRPDARGWPLIMSGEPRMQPRKCGRKRIVRSVVALMKRYRAARIQHSIS